jgi:drug/metabolite transporter (DMT)-like permease
VTLSAFGIFAGLLAAGIWGGMYVISKVVLDIIPPFMLLSLRLILGAVCLAIILVLRGGFTIKKGQIFETLLVGFVGYGISVGLQFVGTKLSTAANAALVTSASPVFIFLFGVWLLKEQITARSLGALLIATLGVVAVVNPRQASFGGELFWGNLALVAAAITWGLYSVLVKRVSQQLSVLELSVIVFLGGLPVSLPLAAVEISSNGVGEINLPVILGVLYLGIVSTALAMYLWNKSLALLNASVVSLLFFAQPVVGVGLGAWLLEERLDVSFWIGAVLIACGLLLSAWASPERRAASSS